MGRPVTIFAGHWADLPFEAVCEKLTGFGYDGLEACTWGDHRRVDFAASNAAFDDALKQ